MIIIPQPKGGFIYIPTSDDSTGGGDCPAWVLVILAVLAVLVVFVLVGIFVDEIDRPWARTWVAYQDRFLSKIGL